MIEIKEIPSNELPKLVKISYENDQELLDKFHIKKLTLQEAIDSTLKMIEDAGKELELKYFEVLFNNTSIGYVIVSGRFIYSFAVAIQYRTKEILSEWWEGLKNNFGDFTIGLLSNNTRAIEYMKKRGMKIAWENPERKEKNEILLIH